MRLQFTLSDEAGEPFFVIEGTGSGPLKEGDTGSPMTPQEKVVVDRLLAVIGDPRDLMRR